MKKLLNEVRAAFDGLSAREQVMVFGLVVALIAMLVGFGGYFVSKDMERREKRIAAKIDKLQEVAALRSDYQRKLAEQRALAQRVKRNANTRLSSYLNRLAEQANVDIRDVRERPGESTGTDKVVELAAVLEVQGVSMDRLDKFLRSIEAGNDLVKIRALDIAKQYDSPELLNATITVGTFKTAEDA